MKTAVFLMSSLIVCSSFATDNSSRFKQAGLLRASGHSFGVMSARRFTKIKRESNKEMTMALFNLAAKGHGAKKCKWKDHSDEIRELVGAGADVNAQDERGSTALHWYLFDACIEDVPTHNIKTLIDLGANVLLKDKHNRTPADILRYFDKQASKEGSAAGNVEQPAIVMLQEAALAQKLARSSRPSTARNVDFCTFLSLSA